MVWEKNFDHKEIMMTPSPCEIPASITPQSGPLDQVQLDASVGAHNYFYKMVARWSSLLAASLTPNKVCYVKLTTPFICQIAFAFECGCN